MTKFLYELTLIVEAQSLEEAEEIVDKIVNADFGKEVSDKIERFAYEFRIDYEEDDFKPPFFLWVETWPKRSGENSPSLSA